MEVNQLLAPQIEILKTMKQYLKNINMESPIYNISSIVDDFIRLSNELKIANETFIDNIKENGPKIYVDKYNDYHIILLRDGKIIHRVYPEHSIEIVYTDNISDIDHLRIIIPPEDIGKRVFFIEIHPLDTGLPHGIYITMEEASILKKQLIEIEREYLRNY